MYDRVRWGVVGICGLGLMLAGCFASKPQPGPAAGAVATGSAASSSPAADVKSERMTSEAASDLGFLRFAFTEPVLGKTPERVPKDLEAAATSIKMVDWRIYERVKSGNYVIHWDTPLNSPVVAYEKDAPTKGGWVLPGNGVVTKMSAEQLQQLLGQKAG